MGWGFSSFYRPGGRGLELSFCPRGGEFAIKKIARGFCRGGWSGLELTDTLVNQGVITDFNDLQKTENYEPSENIFLV